jgi:hypothetical protein
MGEVAMPGGIVPGVRLFSTHALGSPPPLSPTHVASWACVAITLSAVAVSSTASIAADRMTRQDAVVRTGCGVLPKAH